MTAPVQQAGIQQQRGASSFSRGGILAILIVGFSAFIALLYFIGAGDTGEQHSGGRAHAAADGINGYSGLVKLLEAGGYEVEQSRRETGFETGDLLILTPPAFTDAEEFGKILEGREFNGPTLVILPKWNTYSPRFSQITQEDRENMRDDWVKLADVDLLDWTSNLPPLYAFPFKVTDTEGVDEGEKVNWQGMGGSGQMPTGTAVYTDGDSRFQPLITDDAGRILAFTLIGEEGTYYYDNAHWTVFVVDPDIMNNYGLADPARAAAAIALIEEAGYEGIGVTFDLTLNGYGESTNLLTLAFRPPFLAATLCLLLAMLIVGWRAFLRFGPTAAPVQDIAFGKSRLVSNGAGLIVRAR